MSNSEPALRERAWVQRAKGGDTNAFGLLYDANVDGIYRFLYSRTQNRQFSEDLTSKVFLKAWENINSYRYRGHPFRAWLFQIARNTLIDEHRKERDEINIEQVTEISQPSDPVDDRVAINLEVERVVIAMKKLTDEQHQVLMMKLVEGYSTREIARVMHKSSGAVRALQMRALKALQQNLGDEHVET
jgi:RNA polymerase sigma-70 factor (ECF subfamily)